MRRKFLIPKQMERLRVSVVINNYNYGAFVESSVKSVLAQTLAADELIVVDDGSTDDSLSKLRHFAERITIIPKENGGQGSALNAGFEASKGDLVLFLDSDDLLDPDCLETVVRNWRMDASQLVFNLRVIDSAGKMIRPLFATRDIPAGNLKEASLRGAPAAIIPMSGNVFSSAALRLVLPMPATPYRSAADTYLFTVVPLFGPVIAIDRALGSYRIHGSNSSSPIHQGKLNKNWFDKRLAMRAANRTTLRDITDRLGIPSNLSDRENGPVHHQLRYLRSLVISSNSESRSEREGVNLQGAAIKAIRKSDLSLFKKIAISTWMFFLPLSDMFAKHLLLRWGFRHGFVLDCPRFLIQ